LNIFFYVSEWAIALIFLASLAIVIEAGFRIGCRYRPTFSDVSRSYASGILAGSIGLLGLILGFSFSMAVERYDLAKSQTVTEANAIGTAFLRSQTLPQKDAELALSLYDNYVEHLIKFYNSTTDASASLTAAKNLEDISSSMWKQATRSSHTNPNMVPTGLYIQALNELIDAHSLRLNFVTYRVPEPIYLLLMTIALLTFLLAGYIAGISDARRRLSTSALAIMITLVMVVIIDLDRPKRGLIQIENARFTELTKLIDSYRTP